MGHHGHVRVTNSSKSIVSDYSTLHVPGLTQHNIIFYSYSSQICICVENILNLLKSQIAGTTVAEFLILQV